LLNNTRKFGLQHRSSIVIPSEETRVNLYPMDYEEFRWALGDEVTFNLLRVAFETKQSLTDALNHKLMRDFRLYMLIGGMPQAVAAVGMALHKDVSRYKMYLGDTGLFITLAFLDKVYSENTLYTKLLNDRLNANLGYVYENVIAQMLLAAGNELFYYTFPKNNSNYNYEIDFLLSRGEKICPVEVKSSGYKTHASLDAFSQKFSSRIQYKYLLYTKDLRKEGDIFYLPVYMTGLI